MVETEKRDSGKYWEELLKFVNSEVVVESYAPDGRLIETKGRLMAMNFSYNTCIVMTDKEKILVKSLLRIRRFRKA